MRNNHVVLFSGGTGGHVIPSVNFGNYLIDYGYNCTLFLDNRGLQYAGKFKGRIINISSAHLSGNILFKLNSFLLLLYGLIQSFYHLMIIRPSHCISFGSYASFMPLIVAALLRVLKLTEIHLHEQNSIIGKVNLFFLPLSKNIFVNFNSIKNLQSQYRNRMNHVGLPTDNKKIFKKRSIKINKEKKIKIFVYGGSQGSVNLNNCFLKMIKKLPYNYYNKLTIVVQSSYKQIPKIKGVLKDLKIDFELKNFFDDIHRILASSDIVIARSGAGTINDIIDSQIPAILVPLPHSINNHQYLNAKYLVDKHAALLIEEKDLNLDIAYIKFKELIDNISQRKTIIEKLQTMKILDASKLMLKKIFE